MQFTFKPGHSARSRHAEGLTFTIQRLWTGEAGSDNDLSHLMDRSYRYQSERELRWHLAERFGLPVASVELSRA